MPQQLVLELKDLLAQLVRAGDQRLIVGDGVVPFGL
jgi:hypothetical protein